MRAPTRLSLITVCLLALSVPVAGACEAMGEWQEACAMSEPHAMAHCESGTALAASCCGPSTIDAGPDLVLSRPDEGSGRLAAAGSVTLPGAASVGAFRLRAPDPAPPPQPSPYRLFSALLL